MAKIGRDVLSRHDVLRFPKTGRKKIKEIDPWLREYEKEEKEAAARTVSKMLRLIPRRPVFAPYLTSFIRMLYEDKFQFKEPISFNEFPQQVPAKLLLPFNEQIVLPIFPQKSRREFVRIHDLTPEEIAYLYSKKRVLPILMTYPTTLTKEERDCINVLLEKKLPTVVRINFLLTFSSDLKYNDYLKQALQHAKNAKATIREKARKKALARKVAFPERLVKRMEKRADRLLLSYSHLYCLGLGDLVNHIVANYDPVVARIILDLYYTFLAAPNILGLGAMPQIHKDAAFFSWLPSHFKELPKISFARDLVFPVEVGEFLTKYYNLVFPADPSMEIVDKIYRDKALDKARKLLSAFNKAVHEGKREEAWEKGRDLKDVFLEAVEALPAVDRRIEKCRWTLNAVAYGCIGLLGLEVPVVGLLAGIGYRVVEKKVTDTVTPGLAGIRHNPLSIAVWKFEKEFKNVEELMNGLKKIPKQKQLS